MHFSTLVTVDDFSMLEEKMDMYSSDPYNYYNREFVDETEDIKYAYETKTTTGIKFPSGKIIAEEELWKTKFVLKDNLIYEKVGKDKNQIRTAKAKAITIIPNMPVKDIFKTYRSYATHCFGSTYNEEHKAFGYYENPDAMWDWYVVGGRFPKRILVKNTVTDVLESGDKDYMKYAPKGYKWVDGARKRDIEWGIMNKLHAKEVFRLYSACSKIYLTGKVPEEKQFWSIDYKNKCIKNFGNIIYNESDTIEDFCKRHGAYRESLKYIQCWNYVDEEWQEEYRDNYDWTKYINDNIDNLRENACLVMVDCHM